MQFCWLFFVFLPEAAINKYHIEMSYKEELQHVVVSALRVSPEYEPLDYEFRGPELLSLVDADYIDGVDVLTFDIVEDGMSEIVFYSIDSNNPDNIYGHAYKCDISITSDVVDVGGRLWRR